MASLKELHLNYELGVDSGYLRGHPVLHVIFAFTCLRHCDALKKNWLLMFAIPCCIFPVKYYGPLVLLLKRYPEPHG